jgi:hypothetical protein
MSEIVIRLDRSKPFSECRGERTPEDPHYRVHFWQGTRVGEKNVLLPFDSKGELVPDDNRTEPFQGFVEDKPITFHPLYTKDMRDLVERKKKRLGDAAKGRQPAAAEPDDEPGDDDDVLNKIDASDEVNFVSWLRGEARYTPQELRAAAKKRFSKNYTQTGEMVVDLVLDEKLLPENEVCPALAKHLPKAA